MSILTLQFLQLDKHNILQRWNPAESPRETKINLNENYIICIIANSASPGSHAQVHSHSHAQGEMLRRSFAEFFCSLYTSSDTLRKEMQACQS